MQRIPLKEIPVRPHNSARLQRNPFLFQNEIEDTEMELQSQTIPTANSPRNLVSSLSQLASTVSNERAKINDSREGLLLASLQENTALCQEIEKYERALGLAKRQAENERSRRLTSAAKLSRLHSTIKQQIKECEGVLGVVETHGVELALKQFAESSEDAELELAVDVERFLAILEALRRRALEAESRTLEADQIYSAGKEAQELKAKIALLESECLRLHQSSQRLAVELSRTSDCCAQLESDKAALSFEAAEMLEMLERERQSSASARRELSAAGEEMAERVATSREARLQLEQSARDLHAARQEASDLRCQLQHAAAALEFERGSREEQERRMDAKRAAKRRERKTLEREYALFRDSSAAALADSGRAQEALVAAMEATVSKCLGVIRQVGAAWSDERKRMRADLAAAEARLERQSDEREAAERNFGLVAATCKGLQAQVADLELARVQDGEVRAVLAQSIAQLDFQRERIQELSSSLDKAEAESRQAAAERAARDDEHRRALEGKDAQIALRERLLATATAGRESAEGSLRDVQAQASRLAASLDQLMAEHEAARLEHQAALAGARAQAAQEAQRLAYAEADRSAEKGVLERRCAAALKSNGELQARLARAEEAWRDSSAKVQRLSEMLERARLRICHDNNREEPGLLSNLAEALALCEGVGREIRSQWKRSDLEAADSELRLSTSLSKLHSAAATVEERLEELRAACAASDARSCVVSSLRDAQHQEDLEARERALLEAKATLSHERHQHAVSMQCALEVCELLRAEHARQSTESRLAHSAVLASIVESLRGENGQIMSMLQDLQAANEATCRSSVLIEAMVRECVHLQETVSDFGAATKQQMTIDRHAAQVSAQIAIREFAKYHEDAAAAWKEGSRAIAVERASSVEDLMDQCQRAAQHFAIMSSSFLDRIDRIEEVSISGLVSAQRRLKERCTEVSCAQAELKRACADKELLKLQLAASDACRRSLEEHEFEMDSALNILLSKMAKVEETVTLIFTPLKDLESLKWDQERLQQQNRSFQSEARQLGCFVNDALQVLSSLDEYFHRKEREMQMLEWELKSLQNFSRTALAEIKRELIAVFDLINSITLESEFFESQIQIMQGDNESFQKNLNEIQAECASLVQQNSDLILQRDELTQQLVAEQTATKRAQQDLYDIETLRCESLQKHGELEAAVENSCWAVEVALGMIDALYTHAVSSESQRAGQLVTQNTLSQIAGKLQMQTTTMSMVHSDLVDRLLKAEREQCNLQSAYSAVRHICHLLFAEVDHSILESTIIAASLREDILTDVGSARESADKLERLQQKDKVSVFLVRDLMEEIRAAELSLEGLEQGMAYEVQVSKDLYLECESQTQQFTRDLLAQIELISAIQRDAVFLKDFYDEMYCYDKHRETLSREYLEQMNVLRIQSSESEQKVVLLDRSCKEIEGQLLAVSQAKQALDLQLLWQQTAHSSSEKQVQSLLCQLQQLQTEKVSVVQCLQWVISDITFLTEDCLSLSKELEAMFTRIFSRQKIYDQTAISVLETQIRKLEIKELQEAALKAALNNFLEIASEQTMYYHQLENFISNIERTCEEIHIAFMVEKGKSELLDLRVQDLVRLNDESAAFLDAVSAISQHLELQAEGTTQAILDLETKTSYCSNLFARFSGEHHATTQNLYSRLMGAEQCLADMEALFRLQILFAQKQKEDQEFGLKLELELHEVSSKVCSSILGQEHMSDRLNIASAEGEGLREEALLLRAQNLATEAKLSNLDSELSTFRHDVAECITGWQDTQIVILSCADNLEFINDELSQNLEEIKKALVAAEIEGHRNRQTQNSLLERISSLQRREERLLESNSNQAALLEEMLRTRKEYKELEKRLESLQGEMMSLSMARAQLEVLLHESESLVRSKST